ncbi:MAG: phospholipase A [Pseudomonadota bacterium]
MKIINGILGAILLFSASVLFAQENTTPVNYFKPTAVELCWLRQMQQSSPKTNIEEIVEFCSSNNIDSNKVNINTLNNPKNAGEEIDISSDNEKVENLEEQPLPRESSLLADRLTREALADENPRAITSHRLNYLLPFSYTSDINTEPFEQAGDDTVFEPQEAKFQFSVKLPITQRLLSDNDRVYFAFTTLSFWQLYNKEHSLPFRESNYEAELFWQLPFQLNFFNTDVNVATLGVSHQSNGKDLPFSRSWNRVFTQISWERSNWIFQLKPWWRIPEDEKTSDDDVRGDQNPDIEKYMGNFDFYAVWTNDNDEVGILLRNNLRDENRGAIQLDYTFPLTNRLRGYVQLFNGYGESLIDYNQNVSRVGVGIVLSDWL